MYCHGNTLISGSYHFRQVPSHLGSACSWGYQDDSKIQKISTKFTHVWMGIFMSIETKHCHVVVAHVKDMLHWCQHASIERIGHS